MVTEGLLAQFGSRVRERRKKQGLTQHQLSEITDFDQTYISLVERGKRNLSLGNIKKFTDALKTDISTLTEGL